MSMLRSQNLALLRVKPALPLELLAYSFHTTCVSSASRGRQPAKLSRPSSRTRLVKSLQPASKTKSGRLEVAPRQKSRHDTERRRDAIRKPFVKNDPGRFSKNIIDVKSRTPHTTQDGVQKSHNKSGDSIRPRANKHSTSSRSPLVGQSVKRTREVKVAGDPVDEFDRSTEPEPADTLPSEFTSPPLMEGLLWSVHDVLGAKAKPTPIQSLALKHVLSSDSASKWREFLLASETGSGKSLAYMLPMLQDLKQSEKTLGVQESTHTLSPRAIVLAPTHELSRQLSGTAKSLLHNIKLRVVCASQTNTSLKVSRSLTAAKMASLQDETDLEAPQASRRSVDADVLVGTPSTILQMIRGHGWNWDNVIRASAARDGTEKQKRKPFVVGDPEIGLQRVDWVIVDEADVLFDPDFQDSTRMILDDVARARGMVKDAASTSKYPFNLLLTSATIPTALANYLDKHHPGLTRLASPNLHRLPSTLKTEHASWSSGNRAADVEARIRRIWYSEVTHGAGARSKVLVFCNRSTKVEEFGKYLTEKGIPNVALTGTGTSRNKYNNRHLAGFLRKPSTSYHLSPTELPSEDKTPHVLITTSLLSRGLDFSPDIKNVLIVDPPRNMIDFLHRAGRTARAGQRGTVVIFGKTKGRGVAKDKEVRRRMHALRS